MHTKVIMQSPVRILHTPNHTTVTTYTLFSLQKWSGRSHGNHTTKGFLPPKRLLQALRHTALPGQLRLKRMPVVRNQAANVPHRKKSDMMSQLELEKSGVFPTRRGSVNGVFWILLLNIGIYVADHWFQFEPIKSLYLYHDWPRWFQFITSTFCHVNWSHLSSNLFFLYIFGKLVEEEEGGFALWLSYLVTGAGANIVSWLILPRTVVSVGASGAVFGLFAISVLVKISWDWRKILEVLILGQFVIDKVMEAAQASAQLSGSNSKLFLGGNINHIAHLSGALVGVALIWLLSRIPSRELNDKEQRKSSLKK